MAIGITGRAEKAALAQAQAEQLMTDWSSMAELMTGSGSKETLSGQLCVQFAQCTRRIAQVNPKRLEGWEEKREQNISLALDALEKFHRTTHKPNLDTQILLIELSMYIGQHERAKGFIAEARQNHPGHVKCMVLQIENDLDMGGDGKAVLSAGAKESELIARSKALCNGKEPEETETDAAKARRKVAEGWYEHAEFILTKMKRQGDHEKMQRTRDFLAFLAPRTQGTERGFVLTAEYSEKLGDYADAEKQYKFAIIGKAKPFYYSKLAGVQREQVLELKEKGDFSAFKRKAQELSETLRKGREIAPDFKVWRDIEKSVLRPA